MYCGEVSPFCLVGRVTAVTGLIWNIFIVFVVLFGDGTFVLLFYWNVLFAL